MITKWRRRMSGGCGRVVCQEDLLPGHERKGTQDRVHARSCVLDLRRTHSRMHASVLLDSIRGGLVFLGGRPEPDRRGRSGKGQQEPRVRPSWQRAQHSERSLQDPFRAHPAICAGPAQTTVGCGQLAAVEEPWSTHECSRTSRTKRGHAPYDP